MQYQFGYIEDGEFIPVVELDSSTAVAPDYQQMITHILFRMAEDENVWRLAKESGTMSISMMLGSLSRREDRLTPLLKFAIAVVIGSGMAILARHVGVY